MVSAVAGDDAGTQLSTIDARVKEAGGQGLKENGIFNNAYIGAGSDSLPTARASAFSSPSAPITKAALQPAARLSLSGHSARRCGLWYLNRSIFAE